MSQSLTFEELLAAQPRLRSLPERLVQRLCGRRDEDLAQAARVAMAAAWAHYDAARGTEPGTLLYLAARRALARALEARRALWAWLPEGMEVLSLEAWREGCLADGETDIPDPAAPDPEETLLAQLDARALAAALAALPERERRLVRLRYYEERPEREIATTLGLSRRTVRDLNAQALRHLAQRLTTSAAR